MPRQYYRAATYRAADSIGYLFRRAYTLMVERIEDELDAQGFTLTQWIVLIHLRDGLVRHASDFAREFKHDSGALTRVIDQLEKRGLLERRRSHSDRRIVELHLTALGRETIDRLVPVVVGHLNESLEPFTRAEVEQMVDFLHRLVDRLHAAPSKDDKP